MNRIRVLCSETSLARAVPCVFTSHAMERAQASADLCLQLHAALAPFAGTSNGTVIAVLHVQGRAACAAYRGGAAKSGAAPAVRLGCLTKLLTAELVLAAGESRDLDEPAAPPDIARRYPRARGITVRQLLEHTHGLDDSRLAAAPRESNGCIDEHALWSTLCANPPIAEPGEIYSYGHAGAWLAAAQLERRVRRPYEALLRELFDLEWPERSIIDRGTPICAASGGPLALPAPALVELLRRRATETGRVWPTETSSGTFGELRPLPGWNPLERAVHVGWKAHGAGWFGHSSTWPGASALVRIHPERRLAFLIASADRPAAVAAARVFGSRFPELFDVRTPARAGRGHEGLVGRYGSMACSLTVDFDGGALQMRIVDNASGAVDAARASPPCAGGDVFFCNPPLPLFPYLQFVRDAAGTVRFVWNGRFVLRKKP